MVIYCPNLSQSIQAIRFGQPWCIVEYAFFSRHYLYSRPLLFPYEGQRWFDLVRMGGAKEAMKAEGHIIQDYQYLYPIPKTELERINNTELLWQNTGY